MINKLLANPQLQINLAGGQIDSAPMHIAVALNKPLVALFGPTNPAYLLPLQPHFKVINMNGNKSQSDRAEEECTDVYHFALDLLRQG